MPGMDLRTVKEAAAFLNLSPGAVYQLCKSGKLPHYELGDGKGAIRISQSALENYLESCLVAAPPAEPPKPARRTRRGTPNPYGFKHLANYLPEAWN